MSEKEELLSESITFAIEPEVKAALIEVFKKEERDISSGCRYVLKSFLRDAETQKEF